MDRVSRELLIAVYFLSFIVAVEENSYFYLFISIYLMNNYPVQDSKPLKFIAALESKLNFPIALRPKLTIPIIILFYLVATKASSRREYLFDEINHCSDFTYI